MHPAAVATEIRQGLEAGADRHRHHPEMGPLPRPLVAADGPGTPSEGGDATVQGPLGATADQGTRG